VADQRDAAAADGKVPSSDVELDAPEDEQALRARPDDGAWDQPNGPVPSPAAPRVSTRPRGPSTSERDPAGEADTPRGLEVMRLGIPEEPVISPRMTAVFGGLFGLATVASIVALLIQIFPIKDQRSAAAEATSAKAAATSTRDTPETTGPKKRERKTIPGPWRVSKLKGSHRIVRGTMQRRSFITVLQEDGVPKSEIYRILKAMEGVRSLDRTGRKHEYLVAMERPSKKVAGFEYIVSPTEIYQAKTGDDGLLRGARLDMVVREEELATAFYIGPDFVESYKRVGLEEGLSRVINKAFNGRTSTEAFEEGGVVRLVAVETTALGAFVRYERIKAIEYRPPDPSKQPARAYWFEGKQSKGYVDGKGRRPSAKGWRSPCPGAPVTSHFNPKRMHPVLNKVMPHNGTDFGAPSGTPVYAAYRGEVTLVGMHGASGNLVLLDHPDGVQTGYAHLSKFAAGIKRGDKVGTRQLIGYVGSTGRSTGPHLHFSAKRNGKFFNALDLRLDALTLLAVTERQAFNSQRQLLDRALEAIPLPDPPPPPAPEPEPEPEALDPNDGDDPEPERNPDGETDPEPQGDSDPGEGPEPRDDPDAKREDDDGAANGSSRSGSDDSGDSLLGPDLGGDIE
jgi:murein DD-endopeptidase MepM/ murein hydrolase activator NlpD